MVNDGRDDQSPASPTPSGNGLLEVAGNDLDGALVAIEVEPGVTPDQLTAISQALIEEAKRGQPFRLIWLAFYDYPELVEYAGPPLGYARYGPGSKFAGPGDYDKMMLTTRFPTKDWTKRPSQDDVDVWVSWQELRWRPGHVGQLKREQLDRQVAKRLQMQVDQVHAAVRVVDAWATPSIGRMW